jgi:uncharacterized membrane protein
MSQTDFFYGLALTGFFGLFGLLMLWPTLLEPPTHMPVALFLLVMVTPLLLPMRGLLKQHSRSFVWAAILSLLYFMHGSVEAYAGKSDRWPALAEVALSLILFLGATCYLRARNRKHA